ncbi:MAG: putative quinol monooxygenase [Arcobacteraceae bacterium]
MSQIVIVAKITVKEEFRDEMYHILTRLHKGTHANDEGCIQYDFHTDLEDQNSFTFIETWENIDLLNAHMKKEHFLSFVKERENKIEKFEVTKLKKELV